MKAASILTAPLKAIDALADWFKRSQRVLPWREDPSPYRVWISEIMLQQTQVVTVVPYFERFVARFPDVQALATAPTQDVMSAWAGLGYYSRARNLQKGAQAIVEKHGAHGGFPSTREDWLEVPGVGPYTAGAILSIAFDAVEPIVDGNVERVLARVRCLSRAKETRYKERLWRLARLAVESAAARGIRPSVLNQALMELGATICTPKNPKCAICPVRVACRAFAREEVARYPEKKKPKAWIDVKETVDSIFDRRGRALLRQRGEGEWRAGLWDLPSSGDPEARKLAREFEKLGQVTTRHVVTRHRITRVAQVWSAREGRLDPSLPYAWEAPELPLGSAVRKTLERIRETYPEVAPRTAKPGAASSR